MAESPKIKLNATLDKPKAPKRSFTEQAATLPARAIAGTVAGVAAVPKSALKVVTTTPLAIARTIAHSPKAIIDALRKRKLTKKMKKITGGLDKASIEAKLAKFKAKQDALNEKYAVMKKRAVNSGLSGKKLAAYLDQKQQNKKQKLDKKLQKYIKKKGESVDFVPDSFNNTATSNERSAKLAKMRTDFNAAITEKYSKAKHEHNRKLTETQNAAINNKQGKINIMEAELKGLTEPSQNSSFADIQRHTKLSNDIKKLKLEKQSLEKQKHDILARKSLNTEQYKLEKARAAQAESFKRLKRSVKNIAGPVTTIARSAKAGVNVVNSIGRAIISRKDPRQKSFSESLRELRSGVRGTNSFKRSAANVKYIAQEYVKKPLKQTKTLIKQKVSNVANVVKLRSILQTQKGLGKAAKIIKYRAGKIERQFVQAKQKQNMYLQQKLKAEHERLKYLLLRIEQKQRNLKNPTKLTSLSTTNDNKKISLAPDNSESPSGAIYRTGEPIYNTVVTPQQRDIPRSTSLPDLRRTSAAPSLPPRRQNLTVNRTTIYADSNALATATANPNYEDPDGPLPPIPIPRTSPRSRPQPKSTKLLFGRFFRRNSQHVNRLPPTPLPSRQYFTVDTNMAVAGAGAGSGARTSLV